MSSDKTAQFLSIRPRLFGIAYRMLGTRHEADDAIQDAYLRWFQSDTASVQSSEAWLVSMTTRLCIDRLRAAKVQRRAYIGPWLPEPFIEEDVKSPELQLELASDVSVAFLLMLERLSPEERAAFLLHEVFDLEYSQIADILERGEGACRQMVYRSKSRLKSAQSRFEVSEVQHRNLIDRFIKASTTGEITPLAALLAQDARLTADGGGQARTVTRTLFGHVRIAQLFHAVARQAAAHACKPEYRYALVNGQQGLLRFFGGVLHSVLCFETDGTNIVAINIIANPKKLERIGTDLS
jgi:RNA polymerase sigma-70 factor (ECF subfamily)